MQAAADHDDVGGARVSCGLQRIARALDAQRRSLVR